MSLFFYIKWRFTTDRINFFAKLRSTVDAAQHCTRKTNKQAVANDTFSDAVY